MAKNNPSIPPELRQQIEAINKDFDMGYNKLAMDAIMAVITIHTAEALDKLYKESFDWIADEEFGKGYEKALADIRTALGIEDELGK